MTNKMKEEIDADIIAVLTCGRPVPTSELLKRIACKETTLRTHLRRLIESGKVIKVKNHKRDLRINMYALAEVHHGGK